MSNDSRDTSSSQICWNCAETPTSPRLKCSKCNSVLDITSLTHFDIFDIDKSYDLDLGKIEASYFQLQSHLHPDKFTQFSEKDRFTASMNSSFVNEGYQLLCDPIKHATYLLSILAPESSTAPPANDPALMMEIMELSEEFEKNPNAITHKVTPLYADTISELKHTFNSKKYTSVAGLINKLNYYKRFIGD